jgi:hypothetical protein
MYLDQWRKGKILELNSPRDQKMQKKKREMRAKARKGTRTKTMRMRMRPKEKGTTKEREMVLSVRLFLARAVDREDEGGDSGQARHAGEAGGEVVVVDEVEDSQSSCQDEQMRKVGKGRKERSKSFLLPRRSLWRPL